MKPGRPTGKAVFSSFESLSSLDSKGCGPVAHPANSDFQAGSERVNLLGSFLAGKPRPVGRDASNEAYPADRGPYVRYGDRFLPAGSLPEGSDRTSVLRLHEDEEAVNPNIAGHRMTKRARLRPLRAAAFPPARSRNRRVMLSQDFFPRMIKYTAATSITPIRMYMASVMERFLLYERFAISV